MKFTTAVNILSKKYGDELLRMNDPEMKRYVEKHPEDKLIAEAFGSVHQRSWYALKKGEKKMDWSVHGVKSYGRPRGKKKGSLSQKVASFPGYSDG